MNLGAANPLEGRCARPERSDDGLPHTLGIESARQLGSVILHASEGIEPGRSLKVHSWGQREDGAQPQDLHLDGHRVSREGMPGVSLPGVTPGSDVRLTLPPPRLRAPSHP